MQDIKSLRARLASDESALTATHEQIAASQRQIEEAQHQIQAMQSQIEELHARSEAIQKRIALLRQYIDMVEAGEGNAAGQDPLDAPESGESSLEGFPDLDRQMADELGEITIPPTPVVAQPGPDVAEDDTLTFETIDEKRLAVEILPRAHSFEDELLLMMAHHRKAIKPRDLARIFRQWDYTPRGPATEKGIKDQLEADHHFFVHVADGRYALTEEGRAEAVKLFEQLTA